MRLNYITKYFETIVLLLLLSACEEDTPELASEELNLRTQVVGVMKSWYLWNEEVPDVDVTTFTSTQSLMDALVNKKYDRWSYVTEEEAFDQYFKEGTFIGHGFSLRYDENGKLRISLVYPGSPADKNGITRGFEILQINGTNVDQIGDIDTSLGGNNVGVTNRFTMLNTAGEEIDVSITKSEVAIVSVLHSSVIKQEGKKIGYLVFNNFIERSENDLEKVFTEFLAAGIDELVLDMRYNGGGLLNIASKLSSMITSAENTGKLLVALTHNNEQESNNSNLLLEGQNIHLNLNRLLIVTTDASASASEVIINCLKPHMEVVTIGSKSYGKPVGSYGFRYEGYIISPISFRVLNSEGNGNYFEGIPVNAEVLDDLSNNFGNTDEACLKEALHYLKTGTFNVTGARLNLNIISKNRELMHGWRREIGAF
ncbi:MAG: S41 family peptidase [Bacteroidota bacterium]